MLKSITDEHFVDLLQAYHKMFLSINNSIRISQSTVALVKEMEQPQFRAWGYFIEDELVGFVTGFAEKDAFFFSGIYSERKMAVPKLIDYVEEEIQKLGFTTWTTVVNGEVKSVVPKIGAEIEYTRYRKVL